MRESAILLGVPALLALLVACASDAETPRAVHTGVQLRPDDGGDVQGVAFFRQQGHTLSGSVAVWGLEPGSQHAVHFHGPRGTCTSPTQPAVAAHDDLVADEDGVAYLSFQTTSAMDVIRAGFYYNVHETATHAGSSPQIVCADLAPAR